MNKSYKLGLIGALLTFAFTIVFSGFYQMGEWKTVDLRFLVQGEIKTDPRIVMIDADDVSSTQYGRWPWKRSVHAQMIEFLKDAGATTIIYDILFAYPGDNTEDNLLVNATKLAGNIIFPVAINIGDSDDMTIIENNYSLQSSNINNFSSLSSNFNTLIDSISPLKRLINVSKGLGHIAANRDEDGLIRRVPILVNNQNGLFPSLAFSGLLKYLNIPNSNINLYLPRGMMKTTAFCTIWACFGNDLGINQKMSPNLKNIFSVRSSARENGRSKNLLEVFSTS